MGGPGDRVLVDSRAWREEPRDDVEFAAFAARHQFVPRLYRIPVHGRWLLLMDICLCRLAVESTAFVRVGSYLRHSLLDMFPSRVYASALSQADSVRGFPSRLDS